MRGLIRLIPLLVFLCALARGAIAIPAAEISSPPSADRVKQLVREAARDGWAPHARALREAAVAAYEKNRTEAASAWFRLYQWALLLGESEDAFTGRWIMAVQEARVAHANMQRTFAPPRRPLSWYLAPELQQWMLSNRAWSNEFFGLLQPVDYVPAVFRTLNALYEREPEMFKRYANLALAIAVVFDVPPPPDWPHGQTNASLATRGWPAPRDAFNWWIREDRAGRTYHTLTKLGADELRFVVDAAAPFDELEWTQQVANYPLDQLERAYTMIQYRTDRVTRQQMLWPKKSYTLHEILGEGGICVDQGYFATQVGKARGVPTLLFMGAGNDGRHAWFGFLNAKQQWKLDAGRYSEQRFATGYARDPQTWRILSDHELLFLSERFRRKTSYRQSRVHAEFALDFLGREDFAAAAAAARKAVNYERRNQVAWETLIEAEKRLGRDAKAREATLNEAALAFQSFPDLAVLYTKRRIESLRSRGETSAAELEEQRLARKHLGDRRDLTVQSAREILQRAVATQPLAEQVRTYHGLLDRYGRDGGIAFLDQVIAPFCDHLLDLNHAAEARLVVDRARAVMAVQSGTQLEQEFNRLTEKLRRR